jgi:hypothetical protein
MSRLRRLRLRLLLRLRLARDIDAQGARPPHELFHHHGRLQLAPHPCTSLLS